MKLYLQRASLSKEYIVLMVKIKFEDTFFVPAFKEFMRFNNPNQIGVGNKAGLQVMHEFEALGYIV